ncbi:hypothetical protein [Streptomyces crystallinus]
MRRLAVLPVVAGLALSACSSSLPSRGNSEWEKGAGAPEAAAFIKLRIPAGATGVTGAVRNQPRERLYLLSFLTDEKAARSLVDDLRPDHPLRAVPAASSSLSGDGFRHLGLAPPQELDGVRTTSACPPCVGDSRRPGVQGIEVHVGQQMGGQIGGQDGGRVRVYLAAY